MHAIAILLIYIYYYYRYYNIEESEESVAYISQSLLFKHIYIFFYERSSL